MKAYHQFYYNRSNGDVILSEEEVEIVGYVQSEGLDTQAVYIFNGNILARHIREFRVPHKQGDTE